ncbi:MULTISPECIES: DNA helicase [Rhizobium]|uniref:Replicative DNA helicase n=1 Tax=Rhizobium paranaense TaxID=1650438 RepID=A0A7W9D1B1_9HYPH|nr:MULTISPECIES: DNA helicase [Rhizobium]MBB5573890.1 replicative DNA helicase [Rhizobium paranaense]PST61392.1 DNA helicase [Rhizobium sp. SEMIA4064]
MRLSGPIYRLKRKARLMSREENIPLHEALDRIAVEEGFRGWSLLAARAETTTSAEEMFAQLDRGDLVLLGARRGHGKTLMSLRLAVEAMKSGNRGAFFTLEDTESDVLDRFRVIGAKFELFEGLFEFDSSDAISADYIVDKLASAPEGTLVVIDYLQILDQNRQKPELMVQVRALRSFAQERGLIIVFLSQIDRSYDPSAKAYPGLEDVRLPNPLDLALFDKTFFLNRGEVQLQVAG